MEWVEQSIPGLLVFLVASVNSGSTAFILVVLQTAGAPHLFLVVVLLFEDLFLVNTKRWRTKFLNLRT